MALLAALALRCDWQSSRKHLKRGFLTGAAAALVYAVLKRNTGFAVREYYDLGVLIPSVSVCLLLLAAGVCVFKSPGQKCIARLRVLAFCAVACWTAYAAPNLMLYPFDFAVGMDNIFNTEFAFKAAGYASGVILILVTGLALFKTASSLGEGALFASSGLSVAVFFLKGVLSIAQILLGRNLIPRYKWLTRIVMWFLMHENIFVYAMMAACVIPALLLLASVRRAKPPVGNPAQVRRAKFMTRKNIRLCMYVGAGVLMSLLTVTVGVAYSNRRVGLSPPVEHPADGDRIIIPIEMVNDGELHRFVHKVTSGGSSIDVRYIVIKKNDTAWGVGLDACDVCGPTGYYQRKGQVVCILCDVVMNISTIGLPGGCNPVPLKFEIASGNIVIKTSDLAAEARRF
ncbi:MAG: Fe-S-containing protein [Synergistaceae bacterium]|jgi:uncharacterized membrane protein|nr:Fe-S-containing protein [Synergistaceae bacterium]